jgi:hypothetical protein
LSESRAGRANRSRFNEVTQISDLAREELDQRSRHPASDAKTLDETLIALTTGSGDIEIGLAAPLVALAREFSKSETDDEAAAALQRADVSLDNWEVVRRVSVP